MSYEEIMEKLSKVESDFFISFKVTDTPMPKMYIDVENGFVTYEDNERRMQEALKIFFGE